MNGRQEQGSPPIRELRACRKVLQNWSCRSLAVSHCRGPPSPPRGCRGSDRTPGKGRDSPRVDVSERPTQCCRHTSLAGVLATVLPLHCPDSFGDTLTASESCLDAGPWAGVPWRSRQSLPLAALPVYLGSRPGPHAGGWVRARDGGVVKERRREDGWRGLAEGGNLHPSFSHHETSDNSTCGDPGDT